MNDAEVSRQITQMVQFIKQEAEEKANEIAVAAEEEFNIEKLQLVEAEKQKIRKEYERKESQVEVKKKIEYSTQLNAMRLKVLTAREEALRTLLSEASVKLAAFANPSSAAYKALLEKLVSQGAVKLAGMGALKVRCRQADLAAVQEAVAKAAKTAGVPLSVDTASFLPPPPSPTQGDAAACLGGVVVSTADGAASVANTLEERLRISYELNVPSLRVQIFGKSGGHLRV